MLLRGEKMKNLKAECRKKAPIGKDYFNWTYMPSNREGIPAGYYDWQMIVKLLRLCENLRQVQFIADMME
jgi:hypothetical protein